MGVETATNTVPMTVCGTPVDALRAAPDHNRSDVVSPAGVLWPDKEQRRWKAVMRRLRGELQSVAVYDTVRVAGLAVGKGASTLLIPISARRQLNKLSDELVMKLILHYSDAREPLIEAFREL